ncbi:prolyl oligopeptidase family serine peptidase [Gemmata sp. JC673]|uniref:Prolyl oligopeptidase family serine peptidase n=1 Tax=Gemmata algarum TaxID=2975278 RepID=A0ABU5EXX7_9BACT|nr:prolyl oligopeptidase family serine peptidase [Gemmata algarum]MDY3560178.1 prolyl oligopeptidase family serine peptidase [Gemmata algarum]
MPHLRTFVSRRRFLRTAGATPLALACDGCPALAQEKQPTTPLGPLNRFPRTVQEWCVEQVRAAESRGNEVRAKIATKADAEAYVRDVRARVARCFGPFPEKTPLNARVTGQLERDAYTVEKVIFESRPGFHVTANLYVPRAAKQGKKLPGVVGSCGHAHNGKAEPAYQSFSQGLARMGYVVLIFDPIGQGERSQYPHVEKPDRPGVGVGEHLLAGNQQFLVGEFFGSWRAWDGVRALDYLLSRPEVDSRHVGITGNSGGGTMTAWLCGVEPRWTMAAPACFVTTFRRNLENELPADTEQCPPRVLALGLDHADFLACMAPKPVVILAKEKDYFDVRGAEEAFARLRRLYQLLGAEENVKLHIGPTGHGYSIENREAMYQWFNTATGASDVKSEPKLVVEKEEDLYAAPKGQVSELKARTVFSFTAATARQLEDARRVRPGPGPGALAKRVRDALCLPASDRAPDYRILRPVTGRKYPKPFATAYALETEKPAVAVVYRLDDQQHLARPPKNTGGATLYVSHHSADAELRDEPLLAELVNAEPKTAFYACDVRGVGESRPDTCGGTNQFLAAYGSDYFYAAHGVMLDRPYVGQKTFDVLCVLEWLKDVGHKEVHLVAKGWGAVPATFAALLSERVTRVTLKNALTSYADVARAEQYVWPLSCFVPGVLRSFDLPDCYAALAAKKLRLIDPWGANGKPK